MVCVVAVEVCRGLGYALLPNPAGAKCLITDVDRRQVRHVDRGITRVMAIAYALFGVALIFDGAVHRKWWDFAFAAGWMLLGACWWWIIPLVRHRRERSAASKS
jgi:hypothetical protein